MEVIEAKCQGGFLDFFFFSVKSNLSENGGIQLKVHTNKQTNIKLTEMLKTNPYNSKNP